MEFVKNMNNLNNEVRITMPIQSMNKRIVNELKYKKNKFSKPTFTYEYDRQLFIGYVKHKIIPRQKLNRCKRINSRETTNPRVTF